MVDRGNLRGAFKSRGYTQEDMARLLGIRVQTFNRKLIGKTDFKAEELNMMARELRLTRKEIVDIFFADEIT